MKNIEQINAEIQDVRNWAAGKDFLERDQLSRLNFLRNCKFFLERAHTDTENHLRRQLNELRTKVEAIDNGFKAWLEKEKSGHRMTEKEAKSKYRKEMNMKNIDEQIGYLEFLLEVKVVENSPT